MQIILTLPFPTPALPGSGALKGLGLEARRLKGYYLIVLLPYCLSAFSDGYDLSLFLCLFHKQGTPN
jgi:hypothetical protein